MASPDFSARAVIPTDPNSPPQGGSSSGPDFSARAVQAPSLDSDYYPRLGQIEANGNPLAVNKATGASGLYQWMPATAKQYGVDPFNKDQSETGIRKFTADNINQLSSSLGRAPTSAEVYLAHQQGAGGAAKLLGNPDAKAVDVLGKDAVLLNGGSADMSAADFAKMVEDKYTNSNPKSMGSTAAGLLNKVLPDTGGQPQRGYDALTHRQTNTGDLPGALKSLLVGAAHGGIDVPLNSVGQGVTWATDQLPDWGKVGGVSILGTTGAHEAQNDTVDRYNQDYAASPAAHSWMGTAGNLLGGVGAAALTPELGMAKFGGLLGGAARGALGGGVYGAEQNSASGNSLLGDVGLNAGLGGVGGGALGYLARRVGPSISHLFGGGQNLRPHELPPTGEVLPGAGGKMEPGAFTPRAMGQDLFATPADRLPTSVPMRPAAPLAGMPAPSTANAVANVQKAGEEAATRQAHFTAIGAEGESGPTLGMLGRDPKQYTADMNLAKSDSPEGVKMTRQLQGINAKLKGAIDQVKTGTSATTTTEYQAGQSVQDALVPKWKEMQDEVGHLYTGVKKSVGDNFGLQPKGLFDALDEARLDAANDPIVTSVERRLGSMGIADPNGRWQAAPGAQPKTALSISDAERLRKSIGYLGVPNATAANAKRALIDALDGDVIDTAGVDSFKQARAAAKARFEEFERGPLGQIQKGKMDPDVVIRRTVMIGHVPDLEALKHGLLTGTPEQVARGTAAWNNVRGQVVDHLITKAFGTGEEAGKFNSHAFSSALKELTPEKLRLLFTPDELDALNHIRMAGKYAFSDVPFSSINHPNTGIFLADKGRGVLAKISEFLEKSEKTMAGAGVELGAAIHTGGLSSVGKQGLKMAGKMSEARGEAAAARAAMEPDIAAHVAAKIRALKGAPIQKLLGRLPVSQSSAAIYDQERGQGTGD